MVFFGAVPPGDGAVVVTVSGTSKALPGTDAGAVKVTPLAEYPGKGRATGGVRCHRFLKGEDVLLLAWVGPGAGLGRGRQRRSGRPAGARRPPGRLGHAGRSADRRRRRRPAPEPRGPLP